MLQTQVVDVPERSPVGVGEGAFFDKDVLAFPEGIAGKEEGAERDDVRAFLDRTFSRAFEATVFQNDSLLTEDFPFCISAIADDGFADGAAEFFLGKFNQLSFLHPSSPSDGFLTPCK